MEGNQSALVVTRVTAEGTSVRNDVLLERRANGWTVVGYSLRPGGDRDATLAARRATRVAGMRQVAGVLLTGGASRRMGTDKARIVVNGETLAARAARVLSAVCDPVIEVGPERERAARGPGGSARRRPAGRACSPGVGALGNPRPVMLLACDLPFVEPPLLRLLVEWPGTGTVIPVVDGRFQYACARYGARRARRGDGRVALGRVVAARASPVPTASTSTRRSGATSPTRATFADVDTPDDLQRLGLA